jgi:hypothetical protein
LFTHIAWQLEDWKKKEEVGCWHLGCSPTDEDACTKIVICNMILFLFAAVTFYGISPTDMIKSIVSANLTKIIVFNQMGQFLTDFTFTVT